MYTTKEMIQNFQDGDVGILMTQLSPEEEEHFEGSLKAVMVTRRESGYRSVVSLETHELLYFGSANNEEHTLLSLEALWHRKGYGILWEDMGIEVISEERFLMQWIDEKKKENFYAKHFSEEEQMRYRVINEWCVNCYGPEIDFVLEKEFDTTYEPEKHFRLFEFMEKENPSSFNKMRLPGVMETCFVVDQHGKRYEYEFNEEIGVFLEEQVEKLRPVIERMIEEQLKPLYQNDKKAR